MYIVLPNIGRLHDFYKSYFHFLKIWFYNILYFYGETLSPKVMVNILSLQKPLDDIWNFLYGIKCTFIKDKTYQMPCEPVLTPWTHQ